MVILALVSLSAGLAMPAPAASSSTVHAAALFAAAGKADITPDLKTEKVWLAGYGASGRKCKGVHDPLYARALVVSDGRRTAAFVAVDAIGIFREDVLDLRRMLGWDADKGTLFVSATHVHSGPDTLGLWGRFPGVSGVDKRHHRRMKDAIVALVKDLSGRLQAAELKTARADVDPRGLCRDTRDPVVIDPELQAVQLRPAGGKGSAIGTIVRWSCHPEVLGRENPYLTADYPGALCARVEEKAGGTCVFQSGLIGGLLTPEVDRSKGLDREWAEMKRVGEAVADKGLAALASAPISPAGPVRYDSLVVRLPVENSRYLLFLRSLVFGHKLLDADGRPLRSWRSFWIPLRNLALFPLPETLRPWIETEVSRVRVGPVDFLGIPGELLPELAIGGYDGSRRYGHPLVGPTNPNPPDLKKAPKGPYLREKLKNPRGVLVGLANDELGYIIPEYDFQVNGNRSMDPRPPGTHYEETNSTGRSAAPILLKAFDELLAK